MEHRFLTTHTPSCSTLRDSQEAGQAGRRGTHAQREAQMQRHSVRPVEGAQSTARGSGWRSEATMTPSSEPTSTVVRTGAHGAHREGTFTTLLRDLVSLDQQTFSFLFQTMLGVPRAPTSSVVAPSKGGVVAGPPSCAQEEDCCPSCSAAYSSSTCRCIDGGALLRRRTMLDRLLGKVDAFLERSGMYRGFFSAPYMSRLLFSFFFFWSCAYLNAVATMISSRRNPYIRVLDAHTGDPLSSHTLPDLGHDLWSWALTAAGYSVDYIDEHSLPDRWVSAIGNTTLALMVAHPRRFLLLRRVAMTFGTLLLLRAVSVTVTVLPDASPTCAAMFGDPAAQAFKSEPVFPSVLARAVTFMVTPTSMVTCGDMMFSGHTTVLMMCALVWSTYFRAEHLATRALFAAPLTEALLTPLRRAVYAYCAVGCAVIIGSKLHYTLDVLAAIFLSLTVFGVYHAAARDVRASDACVRRRVPALVRWLEGEEVRSLDDGAYERAAAARCD